MDADRFDRLTRTVAARLPRRDALRRLGAFAAGSLLGAAADAAPAAAEACGPDEKGCRVRRNGKSRTVCVALGQCCPNERACDDGTCVGPGACCSGDRACRKKVTGAIVACVAPGQCCPGERRCPDGRCQWEVVGLCCPEERSCARAAGNGVARSCVPGDQCCPDERRCPDGTCLLKELCCPPERTCERRVNGETRRTCVPAGQCCPGDRQCPDGSCVDAGVCCPDERPCARRVNGKTRTTCVPDDQCCPGKRRCPDGQCIADNACCPGRERECKRRVNGRERTTCIPIDQCCPGREVPCPIVNGCCNSLAGEECAEIDGCCDTIGGGKKVCDGTWCCDEKDDCVPGEGCKKPQVCGPGFIDCPWLDGVGLSCCRDDGLVFCCNGTCCGTPRDSSKCCPGRTGCWANHVTC
jgi:hypothetical protein